MSVVHPTLLTSARLSDRAFTTTCQPKYYVNTSFSYMRLFVHPIYGIVERVVARSDSLLDHANLWIAALGQQRHPVCYIKQTLAATCKRPTIVWPLWPLSDVLVIPPPWSTQVVKSQRVQHFSRGNLRWRRRISHRIVSKNNHHPIPDTNHGSIMYCSNVSCTADPGSNDHEHRP